MNVSTSSKKEVDPEGNTKEIVIKNLHCANCGSFVRSEYIEEQNDNVKENSSEEQLNKADMN